MEEDKIITIEIRQETAVMLTFIVVGIMLVTTAFLIPGNSTELWPGLDAGGITAGMYLLFVLGFIVRKPVRVRPRLFLLFAIALLIGASAYSWFTMKNQAAWQRATLVDIRAKIGKGVAEGYATDQLLNTLEDYYHQEYPRVESLDEIFRRQNHGADVGSNVHASLFPGDSLRIYVDQLRPDRIILVAQDPIVKGKNAGFINYGGRKGLAQYRLTLTTKGIAYESEN